MLVLLELGTHAGLLAAQCGLLRRDVQTAAAGVAGDDGRIVVEHVPGGEVHLDGLAGAAGVALENLIGDLHSRAAAHTQNGGAVLVKLPAVGGEVEAGKACRNVSAGPDGGVCLVVAAAVGAEIQGQRLGLSLHVQTVGRDHEGNALLAVPTLDGKDKLAALLRAIAPDVLGAVNGKLGHFRPVCGQGDLRRQRGGVIDHIGDVDKGKLLHRR